MSRILALAKESPETPEADPHPNSETRTEVSPAAKRPVANASDSSVTNRSTKSAEITLAKRSATFRKSVLKAHGSTCACCDISLAEIIEAAHIRPVADDGSDSPSNGLPLCPTHHKAFDKHFLTFDPESREVLLRDGLDAPSLGVTKKRITLSLNYDALVFRFIQFEKASQAA